MAAKTTLLEKSGITTEKRDKSGAEKLIRHRSTNSKCESAVFKKPIELTGSKRLAKVKAGSVLYRVSDGQRMVVYGRNDRNKTIYVVWADNGKGHVSYGYVLRGIYKLDIELGLERKFI